VQQEDPYTFLTIFDTVLLIDDSGSVAGRSWRETSQALCKLLPTIVARDADGIDIFFLNHRSSDLGLVKDCVPAGGYRNVKDVAEVERIFKTVKPGGGNTNENSLPLDPETLPDQARIRNQEEQNR
jgi:hypothetical protein